METPDQVKKEKQERIYRVRWETVLGERGGFLLAVGPAVLAWGTSGSRIASRASSLEQKQANTEMVKTGQGQHPKARPSVCQATHHCHTPLARTERAQGRNTSRHPCPWPLGTTGCLCICRALGSEWAIVANIHLDKLKQRYPNQTNLQMRYCQTSLLDKGLWQASGTL